ncbi:MAG TPA: tRNA (pseudouridine(54)-N(1))-methyltransferase TrmY [Candidatus Poseidoniales archaeon]|nr:MAG TPA: tRNA (pseudouridine(54)-N(1))-methyltransferase TrmY [Candidatus Poseidoniales archaeon]HIH81719.1 tRNA (pseudouridine(54)-N(1))-methyltransferase TrmY [Candidatus Thalassarchaeaceae archaeon]|tara:strand:+ start:4064 stop:4657 length:594 start_codon:yes stop_codon:yes gene_type:complete
MLRRFAIIGHRAPSSGKINLNDLAGSSGRLDVLSRAVNTALFLSHGIRDDSQVILHLLGGPGPARRIFFEGKNVRGLHPDERAIAGQIGRALKEPVPAIGQKSELHSGFYHSGGTLEQTLAEWRKEGVSTFVLDAEGQDISEIKKIQQPLGFILSDDQPFSESDLDCIDEELRISLGKQWLQGHACITIIHHVLDQS